MQVILDVWWLRMSKRTGDVDSAGIFNGSGGMKLRCGASGRDGVVEESFIPEANPPLRIVHTVTLGCQV